MDKKRGKPIVAYLPAFSFTLAYLSFQYLFTGASITSPITAAIRPLLVFFVILSILGLIVNRIFRDHTITGLVLWLVAELILFSQDFIIFSGIFVAVLFLVWIVITYIRKRKVLWTQITFMLTISGFGIVFIFLITQVSWEVVFSPIPKTIGIPTQTLTVPDQPPDIYYIVMDAYADSRILDELYDFDNFEFTNYLLEKGFIIPETNYSNYALSALSLGSTLNMDYVHNLLSDAEKWKNWWLMSPLIEDSLVREMLEASGYQTVVVGSGWDITDFKDVDIYRTPFPIRLSEFEKLLVQTSSLKLFSPLIGQFTQLSTYESHRKIVEFAFETLSEIPEITGQKFIFSHITTPHTPFVFTKEGNAVTPSHELAFADGNLYPGTQDEYKQGYIEQLQYVNNRLEKVIDSILGSSENPPIIILLSDHGPRLLTDYSIPANTCIHEAYSNFAAFYLPGMDDDVVPDDISPVNVFRIIFNQYFDTEYYILENAYYFTSDSIHYYQFEDVSSQIYQECEVSN